MARVDSQDRAARGAQCPRIPPQRNDRVGAAFRPSLDTQMTHLASFRQSLGSSEVSRPSQIAPAVFVTSYS